MSDYQPSDASSEEEDDELELLALAVAGITACRGSGERNALGVESAPIQS